MMQTSQSGRITKQKRMKKKEINTHLRSNFNT